MSILDLSEGDTVKVIHGRHEGRHAVVTGLHLKDVSIEFLDTKKAISTRYHSVQKIDGHEAQNSHLKRLLGKALDMIKPQRSEFTDVDNFCTEIENILNNKGFSLMEVFIAMCLMTTMAVLATKVFGS